MAEITPPRQFTLDMKLFPKEPWAKALVEALNQFSIQTVQALTAAGPKYKLLKFNTGPTVADSFPIDVQVETMPTDVHVARVPMGTVTANAAVAVQWRPLSAGQVRVTDVSGLLPNTTYAVLLAME